MWGQFRRCTKMSIGASEAYFALIIFPPTYMDLLCGQAIAKDIRIHFQDYGPFDLTKAQDFDKFVEALYLLIQLGMKE